MLLLFTLFCSHSMKNVNTQKLLVVVAESVSSEIKITKSLSISIQLHLRCDPVYMLFLPNMRSLIPQFLYVAVQPNFYQEHTNINCLIVTLHY